MTLYVLLWSLQVVVATARDFYPRSLPLIPSNTSSPAFHHKAFHNSIILGDYLYIDGGDITTWNGIGNGTQTDQPQHYGNITTAPDYFTYTIDLTQSWTNRTVEINTVAKGDAPVVVLQALWADAEGKTFYQYDGGISQSQEL